MTSIGPYSQPMDFTHMLGEDFISDNEKLLSSNKKYTEGTIMRAIEESSLLKKFRYIIKKAELDDLLNNTDLDFTIFVTFDKYIDMNIIHGLDKESARRIVLSSLIDKRVTSDIIRGGGILMFISKYMNEKIICYHSQNYERIIVNSVSTVLKEDIICDNGVIHSTDNLLLINF